jgi:ankyrin repeat protein
VNRENTPLHYAAFQGHVDACKILLLAGSDTDSCDKL